jgi:iron complex transport system ATP-binding protein
MERGSIVAQGDPREVVTENLVRRVFDLDARVIDDPVAHTPLIVPIGRHHRPVPPSHPEESPT